MNEAKESGDSRPDIDRFWRIDVDLAHAERVVKSWRQQEELPPPLPRNGAAIHRVDPPIASTSTPPRRELASESLVSLLACEMMAITALLILLIIETQHSPDFARFLSVACAGASVVVGITVLRWIVHQRRSSATAAAISNAEATEPAANPSGRSKSLYDRVTRDTRPDGWR